MPLFPGRCGTFVSMKHKRFRWLAVSIAIALAGIISLQAYWLDKAASIERRKFEEEVTTAMADATERLETYEAFTLITDALVPEDMAELDSLTMMADLAVAKLDSSEAMRFDDMEVARADAEAARLDFEAHRQELSRARPDSLKPGDRFVISRHKTRPGVLPPGPPVPPPPGRYNLPEIPAPPIGLLSPALDTLAPIRYDSNVVVLRERTKQLRSAVKNVYMEYMVDEGGNAVERVSEKQVKDALQESFASRNIQGNFSFAVYSEPMQEFIMLQDSSAKEKFLASPHRVPLFPHDIRPGGEELRVVIETPQSRILLALWPQLVFALMLTAVLIVVFFLTFREALRQKKLSDIRNDFINNMTHEFKTPIATISLAADTIRNPAISGNPEKVQHYSDIIKRESRRMNEQVENVLELALAGRNELELAHEQLDLADILRRAVQSMMLQVSARNGSLLLDIRDLPESFHGDAFHLERAFTNLLDNAVKYSPGAPEISVSAFREANQLQLVFSDNGCGISKEEQGRIFDRFYRVPTGNRHDVKGFGLGLSYVKLIIEKHGGRISVKSAPGKGSTFTATFPL
jgi:two-component system, OmpR family, phosphate regulon sensor histidine kinase PhoR